MKYRIYEDVSIIRETSNWLYYIVNEDKVKKYFEELVANNIIKNESSTFKDIKRLFKCMEKFKAANKIPLKSLKLYYASNGDENNKFLCVADIFLFGLDIENIEELKKEILNMHDDELKEKVMKLILSEIGYLDADFETEELMENVNANEEFMKYLVDGSELKEEIKWNLVVIANNPRKYVIELLDIIETSMVNFKKAIKDMENDINKFVVWIKNKLEENNSFISEITGLKALETWKKDVDIYLSFMSFYSVTFGSSKEFLFKSKGRDIVYFGWKFFNVIENAYGKKEEESLLRDRLKCLSDKSKFKILTLIKGNVMFGQEIAEKMNLTTATVSHHMNSLVIVKLVYVEHVENKIYYKINEKAILETIDSLKKAFYIK